MKTLCANFNNVTSKTGANICTDFHTFRT